MALATDLMGLGMAAPLAFRAGRTIATLAGVGTAQATGATIRNSVTEVTTSSGQTAVVLPSNAALAKEFYVFNTSSTTALVFPPSGGAIDGGSTDASVSVAQNKGRMFMRTATNTWRSILGA